jgi:alanine dehydrogenase
VARIGIRREDKSRWEARTPLVPADVARYVKEHGIEVVVQTSPHRAFKEAEYQAAGASIADELANCPLIMGIKEIPPEKLEPNKTYTYFSHTIKGQSANMPALRRLMELKCQLIDYEKIVDDRGRRLVFFGTYAGMAGMIDSLWALGQRLQVEGIANPFSRMQQAYHYRDVAHAKEEIAKVGEDIKRHGLPQALRPFVCGFAGYGQVSKGAQEVFDALPIEDVSPKQLASLPPSPHTCYKVVFREEDMVERIEPAPSFDLQEYYKQPERYRGQFAQYVPHLTLLINCIYWEPKYPRLVTLDQLHELYGKGATPRLRVIGDISCDLNGSVECTVKSTKPDHPVFVYDAASGAARDGVEGHGPVVLAVDFLPCELPVDSSRFFSLSLQPFVVPLANADFRRSFTQCGLPPELERATIVYQGELTPSYRYLEKFLK